MGRLGVVAILAFWVGLLGGGSPEATAQPFQDGTYRNTGPDGLINRLAVSTQGSAQQIAENHNMDLSSAFGCKLVLNYRSAIAVPPGYNQKDFLGRKLLACTWTANECGFPDCDGSILSLNDGQFYAKGAGRICAVYRSGDSTTSPACFTRVKAGKPVRSGPRGIRGIQINIR